MSGLVERPSLNDALRQTGIIVQDNIPWGTHLCLFHETRQDFVEHDGHVFQSRIGEQRVLFMDITAVHNSARRIRGIKSERA